MEYLYFLTYCGRLHLIIDSSSEEIPPERLKLPSWNVWSHFLFLLRVTGGKSGHSGGTRLPVNAVYSRGRPAEPRGGKGTVFYPQETMHHMRSACAALLFRFRETTRPQHQSVNTDAEIVGGRNILRKPGIRYTRGVAPSHTVLQKQLKFRGHRPARLLFSTASMQFT